MNLGIRGGAVILLVDVMADGYLPRRPWKCGPDRFEALVRWGRPTAPGYAALAIAT